MLTRIVLSFFLLVILGCSESDSSKTASLVQPRVEVKDYGDDGNNPKVKLPLLTWPSFKEQNIKSRRGLNEALLKEGSLKLNNKQFDEYFPNLIGEPWVSTVKSGTPANIIQKKNVHYIYFYHLVYHNFYIMKYLF